MAALVVTGALVVAGCSGSGGGTPSTSTSTPARTSTTTSVTASTTASPTTKIDPLTALQREAIATVGSFYAAFDAGAKSRSSKAFRKTYAGGCEPCEAMADRIDMLAKKRLTLEGGAPSTIGLSALQGTDKGIGVQGDLVSGAAKLRDSSGRVTQSFEQVHLKNVLWLVRREGAHLEVVEIRG